MKKIINYFLSKVGLLDTKSFCPVCGNSGSKFNPLPELYSQKAKRYGFIHFGKGEMTAIDTYSCATCGASDRERLYAFWLTKQITNGQLTRSTNTIHFAPEYSLSNFIKKSQFFSNYLTADLMMKDVNYNVDLLKLPFSNDSFDFFICSHVLEHVADDQQAIKELFRITRPGGCGILMAPIFIGLSNTLEDPTVTSTTGRWRLFGQFDHVRLYSHNDYIARIKAAGFYLDELDDTYFGSKIFTSLGLKQTSKLYIARKPGRF